MVPEGAKQADKEGNPPWHYNSPISCDDYELKQVQYSSSPHTLEVTSSFLVEYKAH